MPKFKFVHWLSEFLESQVELIFEWDNGNTSKSENKHGITREMVESSFSDCDKLAFGEQYQPEVTEGRYGMISKAFTGELLFICFTIRNSKIRPISARPANKKERSVYDK